MPQLDFSLPALNIQTSEQERSAVRTEGHGIDGARAGNHPRAYPGLDVPQPCFSPLLDCVASPRREQLPIGAEGHRTDGILVHERFAQGLAALCIPELCLA